MLFVRAISRRIQAEGEGFVLRLRESGVPLRARASCAEWLECEQRSHCWPRVLPLAFCQA